VTLTAWWAGLAWRDLGALRLPQADDMLRLAQMRDWLDGQGFGDLTQHRLGPPGGTDMAWSRLPDILPAALIRLLSPLIGMTRAEIAAVIFWPEILLLLHLLLAGALARRLGPPNSAYAAVAIAALAFPAIALFEPGRIAGHGMQIVIIEAGLLAWLTRRFVWVLFAVGLSVALVWPGGWNPGEGLLGQPPGRALAHAGLPVVAAVWASIFASLRRSSAAILFAALIDAAALASLFVLEAAALAAALAAPALAQLILLATKRGAAWQVAAWITSAGLVWQAVGELLLSPTPAAALACTDRDSLSALDRLDTGAFVAPMELSAYIVGATTHRSLAGPNPRNTAGNRAAAELLGGSPEEARYQASLWSVDYIALCPDATGGLPRGVRAGSLAGHLLAGAPPAWLDPVPLIGSDLRVWRVQPVAAPGLRP
jgi:hypothetical protein